MPIMLFSVDVSCTLPRGEISDKGVQDFRVESEIIYGVFLQAVNVGAVWV